MTTQARIAGTVMIDGVPAARDVIVISDDPAGRQVVGEGASESDGTFDITYEGWAGSVIALALDQYGDAFAAETALSQGEIIHPNTPNGYVYEVTTAGTTGTEEPTWSTSASVTSGSVTFNPRPYYRPVASGPLQGEAGAPPTPTDPEFDSVTTLLHFNGADNDTAVVDQVGANWVVIGSAHVSHDETRFGVGSFRSAANDSGLTCDQDILTTGANFTVEGWANLDDLDGASGNGVNILFSQSESGGSSSQQLDIKDGKLRLYRGANAQGGAIDITGTATVTPGQWFYWALAYDGVNVYGFIDGALQFSTAWNGWSNNGFLFRLGDNLVINYPQFRTGIVGYLDEVRITDGVCRYDGSFTPPDAPFPDEGP